MTEKRIIGIDIDDTICESYGAVAKVISHRFNVPFGYDDITDYHLRGISVLEHVECDWIKLYRETFTNSHHEFSPVPGSQEVIRSLHDGGYTIAAITARWEGFLDITHEWLKNHFSGLIDEVHYLGTEDSYHVSKAEKCRELGVICMIEDHIDHCIDLANHGISTFLLERPWNRERTENHPLITRVSTWQDIYDCLAGSDRQVIASSSRNTQDR